MYITNPTSSTSKFTIYMTMIPYFFFIIVSKFFTNLTTVTLLKQLFFFFTHDQIFIKVFVHYFSAIFILLKNCFNKLIGCIFTLINNNWLSKRIINANNFVNKTTSNLILIFFWVRTFTDFSIS